MAGPSPKSLDYKFYGPEPVFREEPTELQLTRALNWYNYFHDYKDFKEWVLLWLRREGRPLKDIQAYQRSVQWKSMPSMGSVAKLLLGDSKVPEKYVESFKKKVQEVIDTAPVPEEPKEEKKPVRASIQSAIDEKVSETIAEIEHEVDLFMESGESSFSSYEFLKKADAKAYMGERVAEKYRGPLAELEEALRGKDQQLNEAYSHLSKRELRTYVAFFFGLISDAERFSSNAKTTRPKKARKKREKSSLQLVRGLKFLPESKEHKLVSIDPTAIIGSSQVWAFNVRTKVLTRYDARATTGLTVKGTSIVDWDEDRSESKKLRKPDEAMEKLLSGGKRELGKLMGSLTTKPSKPSGRINQDTIIARAVK